MRAEIELLRIMGKERDYEEVDLEKEKREIREIFARVQGSLGSIRNRFGGRIKWERNGK